MGKWSRICVCGCIEVRERWDNRDDENPDPSWSSVECEGRTYYLVEMSDGELQLAADQIVGGV